MSHKNLSRRTFLSWLAGGAAACALALSVSACGGAPVSEAPTTAAEPTIAVSVTIDPTAAEVDATTVDVDVPEGATVYDALVETGADVNAKDSSYGTYVAGINGVAEQDFGPMSGWLFEVNGESSDKACSEYVLEDGDEVTWTYVTDFTATE